MGCCTSQTTGAGAVAVDTDKRVNYTQGMLLGVDDFVQEQAWHIARRHELAREVLGYGTVRGLKVDLEPGGGPPRVRVSPGLAYMPSGTPVCVGTEQCCDINAWLLKNWDKLPTAVNGAVQPAALRLYVVLSYLAVPTDLLPVPGEPCRDEADLTAASRLADCFRLELRTQAPYRPEPPPQLEEDAIRDFADWLAQVPVGSSSPPLDEATFLGELRAAATAWLQPVSPDPADFMFGSPPALLGSSDALLRAALRLWVTELRPLWRAKYGCGPLPTAPGGEDDALLLAALDLQVYSADRRAEPDPRIAEDQRPVLLSLRMVQELVTQNPAPEPAGSVAAAQAFGMAPQLGLDTAYARADHHHGTPTLPELVGDAVGPIAANEVVALRGFPLADVPPQADDALVFSGGQWAPQAWPVAGAAVVPGLRFAQPIADGVATGFARADHSHGTPTLSGDAVAVDVGTPAVQEVRVRRLNGVALDTAAPLVAGQVLMVQVASGGLVWRAAALPVPAAPPAPPVPGAVTPQTAFGLPSADGSGTAYALANHTHGTPSLAGDVVSQLSGGTQQARVVRLQGRELSAAAPLNRQVLAFNGSAWVPTDLPAGGPTPPPVLGGDVTGPVASAFIENLQRVPVKAEQPRRGDVLTFDGNAWVPGKGGGGGGAIQLVAAGSLRVNPFAQPPRARVDESAGRDSVKLLQVTPNQVELELVADGIPEADGALKGFIVKLTPMWNDKQPMLAYLGSVGAAGRDSLRVVVVLFSQRDFINTPLGLQYEISRYQPFQAG